MNRLTRSTWGLSKAADTHWSAAGVCRDDPDWWSDVQPQGLEPQNFAALEGCAACPVQAECAADAVIGPRLINQVRGGFWFGPKGYVQDPIAHPGSGLGRNLRRNREREAA